MEDIQKLRLRLLTAAMDKGSDIDQAIEKAQKAVAFVMGNDVQKPIINNDKPAKRIYVRKDRTVIKDRAMKVLEAMIAMYRAGERVTLNHACAIAFNGRATIANERTEISAFLIKNKYVERSGSGKFIRWRPLKNPDGSDYIVETIHCPAEKASGYGWSQKLGDIARVREV